MPQFKGNVKGPKWESFLVLKTERRQNKLENYE